MSARLVLLFAAAGAVAVVATLSSSCQLAAQRGNVGLECDDAGDCDDPDLGCVTTDSEAAGSQKVCMPPPSDWQCKGKFFGDGACDCGCGFLDSDCPSLSSAVCAQDGNNCPVGQNPIADNNIDCQ
jgi:hypothetical protein